MSGCLKVQKTEIFVSSFVWMNSMGLDIFHRAFGAGVLLGLAAPTMICLHHNPQSVVYAECWVALSITLGFCVFALSQVQGLVVRLSMVLPAGGLLTLAFLAGSGPQAAGYAAYVALFLVCVLLSASACDEPDEWGLVEWLATGLLACAALQSVAGLVQLANWPSAGLVMQKMYLQAFGNIGQANHYANLVFLGLGSLSFLHARRLLNGWWMIGLAAWLSLAAAASASRSVWLYTFVFAFLGAWAQWRGGDEARRAGRALLVVVLCSVVAQLLVAYGNILDVFGVTSSLERAGDAGSNGQRLYNWQAAWLAIQEHPWLGQGPGSFYKASIDSMFLTPPEKFPKFAEHAHNLPLNLAVEFGVPIALLVTGAIAWWFIRHLRRAPTPTSVWCLAVVGVIGAHSMVEYPLWYTYFLIPFGLCMGIADAEDESLRVVRIPRWVGAAISVVGLGVLTWIAHDWFAVREAYVRLGSEEPNTSMATREAARAELDRVSRFSVFALHAESLRLQSWHPDEPGAAQIAERCDAHWHYKPGWYMMMRCGEAYALTQNTASLDRLAVALCDGFSYHRPALREWAQGFDAQDLPGLKLAGRSCL
ncbi:hypothetical protein C0V76_11480 [Uliginosibacterium sp. TH139]|nr:hypothetical protein C0V76_11480 [Uliginosibacterium sp. TH139]